MIFIFFNNYYIKKGFHLEAFLSISLNKLSNDQFFSFTICSLDQINTSVK